MKTPAPTIAMLHQTPKHWLREAIAARAIAARLTDPQAKRVMEEAADECDWIAQTVRRSVSAVSVALRGPEALK
jgi:hypothetical protein